MVSGVGLFGFRFLGFEVCLVQDFALPVIHYIDDGSPINQTVELHYILIGMTDASVTDILAKFSRRVGSMQSNLELIQCNASDAKRILVIDIIWLYFLALRINIFWRIPNRIHLFLAYQVSSRRRGRRTLPYRVCNGQDSHDSIVLKLQYIRFMIFLVDDDDYW